MSADIAQLVHQRALCSCAAEFGEATNKKLTEKLQSKQVLVNENLFIFCAPQKKERKKKDANKMKF